MGSWRWGGVVFGGLIALVAGAESPLEGQVAGGVAPAGVHLHPEHWAVAAARRLDALRLVDDFLPAQRSVPVEVVARVFEEAADRADGELPDFLAVVEEWRLALEQEYPRLVSAGTRSPRIVGQGVGGGGRFRRGAAAPGLGEFDPDRTGALPLPDRDDWVVTYEAAAAWSRFLAAGVSMEATPRSLEIERIELVAAAGSFGAAIGRTQIGYAHGFGGGIILTGAAPIDAIRLGTRMPVRLPSVLRLMGPFAFETFIGRMFEGRHPGDPFIWGASGHFRPIPRATLGIHRAALFGGDPENHPVTARKVVNMLLGRVVGVGFEDQVVSASGKLVLPTERWLPLEAYFEWGAEDATGAWWDVPGRVIGVWSPMLPFAPEAAVGFEFTHFGTSCCLNPQWYRHWSFEGSWASRDRTLGHPLGGDGREYLVHGSADLGDPRLRLTARVFQRERREENLFSPGRTGTSRGGVIGLELRRGDHFRLKLDAGREAGDHWTESTARILGRVIY
jgi:hypothetical protein